MMKFLLLLALVMAASAASCCCVPFGESNEDKCTVIPSSYCAKAQGSCVDEPEFRGSSEELCDCIPYGGNPLTSETARVSRTFCALGGGTCAHPRCCCGEPSSSGCLRNTRVDRCGAPLHPTFQCEDAATGVAIVYADEQAYIPRFSPLSKGRVQIFGGESCDMEVTLIPTELADQTGDCISIPGFGTIQLTCSPDGSQVFVAGHPAGTPCDSITSRGVFGFGQIPADGTCYPFTAIPGVSASLQFTCVPQVTTTTAATTTTSGAGTTTTGTTAATTTGTTTTGTTTTGTTTTGTTTTGTTTTGTTAATTPTTTTTTTAATTTPTTTTTTTAATTTPTTTTTTTAATTTTTTTTTTTAATTTPAAGPVTFRIRETTPSDVQFVGTPADDTTQTNDIPNRCFVDNANWPDPAFNLEEVDPLTEAVKICDVLVTFDPGYFLATMEFKNVVTTPATPMVVSTSGNAMAASAQVNSAFEWHQCGTAFYAGEPDLDKEQDCPLPSGDNTPDSQSGLINLGLSSPAGAADKFSYFCSPGTYDELIVSQTPATTYGEMLVMRFSLPATSTATISGTVEARSGQPSSTVPLVTTQAFTCFA